MTYRDIQRQAHLYVKETNCFYFRHMYEGVKDKVYYMEATQAGKLPKRDFHISVLDSAPEFLYQRLKNFFGGMPAINRLKFEGFCPNCEEMKPAAEIRVTGLKLNYCFLCGKQLRK